MSTGPKAEAGVKGIVHGSLNCMVLLLYEESSCPDVPSDLHNNTADKGIVQPKIKIINIIYILTTMPMAGRVKCLSPQNTFGVSGVNGVAAKSKTIEVTGGPLLQTYKNV